MQLLEKLMVQLCVASNENKTKNKTQVIHEAGSVNLLAYNCKHLSFRIFRESSVLQDVQSQEYLGTTIVFDQ